MGTKSSFQTFLSLFLFKFQAQLFLQLQHFNKFNMKVHIQIFAEILGTSELFLEHYGLLKSFPNGQFEANLWRGAELCLGSCLVKKQACQALCCLQTLSAKGSFIELGLGQ